MAAGIVPAAKITNKLLDHRLFCDCVLCVVLVPGINGAGLFLGSGPAPLESIGGQNAVRVSTTF